MTEPIIWTCHQIPGRETCRLLELEEGWRLEGAAVLNFEGQACRLDYLIDCDPNWSTRAAVVTGWVGERNIDVIVARDEDYRWVLNGVTVPEVEGCTDLDLNFSPSTNTLPIRRLVPKIDDTVAVRAAWLRFPSFELEPLEQSYTRWEHNHYRYESAGGAFKAEISIDDDGLVIDYADIWARDV
jgi:hypothetical protein